MINITSAWSQLILAGFFKQCWSTAGDNIIMESNQKKEKRSRQSITIAELILHNQNSRKRLEKRVLQKA